MEKIALRVEKRSAVGKEAAKKLRHQKKIPAVVYGVNVAPVSLVMEYKDFSAVLHNRAGANALIDLHIGDTKKAGQVVIIKEVQHHPVSDLVRHVDFQAISLTDRIRVRVPVHGTGESPGVTKGGVIDFVHHELEVECLPTEIPEKIDVDLSHLDFGHAVHVKDLKLPAGIVSTVDPDEVVVTVKAPREEEVATPAEGEAVEPEVIKKGKEDKEGEEGEEAKPEAKGGAAKPAAGAAKPAAGAAKPAAGAPGKGAPGAKPAGGKS